MIRSDMLGFSATDKAVTKIGVVHSMLRKQIPPKVLIVSHTLLRRIRARMANVPHMPGKPTLVHCFADATVTNFLQQRHDVPIELANPNQLGAWN